MKNNLDFKQLSRYGISMRLIEEEDAEFVLQLRTDSELAQHLSPTSHKLEDQINWIREYKKRELSGLEYYFITVGPDGQRWGTTRLSELDGECFELGSWLFSKEAPFGYAIKADIITKEIGFDNLKFEKCKFDVRKQNKTVLKYHLKYNPIIVRENDLNIYFNLTAEDFFTAKKKFIKLL